MLILWFEENWFEKFFMFYFPMGMWNNLKKEIFFSNLENFIEIKSKLTWELLIDHQCELETRRGVGRRNGGGENWVW